MVAVTAIFSFSFLCENKRGREPNEVDLQRMKVFATTPRTARVTPSDLMFLLH
jgi:hypothetical protein